jgi:hypothetical protein
MNVIGRLGQFKFLEIISAALLMLVVGCSNPLNYEVSKLTPDEQAVVHATLTASQCKILDDWIERRTVSGSAIPTGVTVDQALRDQTAWIAKQQAEKTQAEESHKQKLAQHAARQQELARLVSVALVSKTNKVLLDERKFVALELEYANKTDKDIQEVKGVMKIVNVYGDQVIDIDWTYNRGISSKQTLIEHTAGIFINQSAEPEVEFWNTDFERLIFTFEIKAITFKNGTSVIDS